MKPWRCPGCKRVYRSEGWVTRHQRECREYAQWHDREYRKFVRDYFRTTIPQTSPFMETIRRRASP